MAATPGKDGAVAPQERVNIRYRTETNGAVEDVELPLRMLVAGDFTGRPDDTPLEERKPINVESTHSCLKGVGEPNVIERSEQTLIDIALEIAEQRENTTRRLARAVLDEDFDTAKQIAKELLPNEAAAKKRACERESK